MRLIDADALIEQNKELADNEIEHPKYQMTLREVVDEMPTIDAVPVVRCKNCKRFDSDMERCVDGDEHPTRPDAFCAWAERRDG